MDPLGIPDHQTSSDKAAKPGEETAGRASRQPAWDWKVGWSLSAVCTCHASAWDMGVGEKFLRASALPCRARPWANNCMCRALRVENRNTLCAWLGLVLGIGPDRVSSA
jgi:hypothetical protein